ncbi:MAG: GGDEF domain-containing protein [Betaproteobacteria bacterium]|nr:GGDEF domain-containing protein [Betaproteobacteria bacterium]
MRFLRLAMLFALAAALPGWAAPAVKLAELIEGRPLGRSIDVLEDASGTLGIEDLRKTPDELFARGAADALNFGYSNSIWWLRFKLAGDAEPREPLLEIRFPSLDHVDVYALPRDARGSDAVTLKRGGDSLVWAARDVRHRNHVFRLSVPANAERTFYVRVASESVVTVPAWLWQPDAFAVNERDAMIVLGLFYGLVIALFLYNLMLFLALRDRVYLWYVLYTASFGMFLFTFDGLGFEHLWPNSVWWANHALATALSLTLAFGVQFARSFLVLPRIALAVDRFSQGVVALAGLFAFSAATGWVLSYGAILRALSVVSAVTATLVLYISVREVLRGDRPTRFFLLAWVALLVSIAVGASRNFALVPTNFFTVYGLHIGLALDVVLLSFGLADRIGIIKHEKLAAQAEALATHRALLEATRENERELERRIGERTAEINRVNEKLREEALEREGMVARLREQEERMRFMAQHDALTGLPNRYSMQERLSLALELAKRNRKHVAVMLVDLDDFKAVNDTRGHAAGDQVLIAVANRLRSSVRGSDTVARIGGDEFVVLAGELDRADGAGMIAEKIADMVQLPIAVQGGAPWSISCSIGISVFPQDAQTSAELLAQADRAMYAAKAAKDRRIAYYAEV